MGSVKTHSLPSTHSVCSHRVPDVSKVLIMILWPVIARTTFLSKSHQVSTRNSMMDGAHAHLWTWCPSYEINFLRLARIWSPSESPLKNFPLWNNLGLFFLKSDEGRKRRLEWYLQRDREERRCLMTTFELLRRSCCSDSPEDRVTPVKSELPPFTLPNHWPSEPSRSSTRESGFGGNLHTKEKPRLYSAL